MDPPETKGATPQSVTSAERWLKALGSHDVGAIVALYDADATLLPTFSEKLERGRSAIRRYFDEFVKKRPTGEVVQEHVQELGDGRILCTGLYNFRVGPGDLRETVTARFTFVWRRKNDDWRIVHHHSSQKPAM